MPVGTNIPVEEVEALAATISSEASNLESTLTRLRSQCERNPAFSGNAAQKYDDFLTRWDTSQREMLESIRGASNVLARLAQVVRENSDTAAGAFNN